MNTLESAFIHSPIAKDEECALFRIENTENPFVLHDVTSIGDEYTLTFWIKADNSGSLQVIGNNFDVTTDWVEHIVTFTADNVNIAFVFQIAGNYYMYHPQLEVGNQSTDWTPSPDDMATADDVDLLSKEIISVNESVSSLDIKTDNITASVSEIKTVTETSLDSVNKNIETLSKEVSTKMTSTDFEIRVKEVVQENGSSKVVTEETGYTFDKTGLTIDKTDSETKTQITENGMTVYQKDGDNENAVLTANSNGVDAKNLHATTYLIIGGRSRFENFGNNRTGCFWIGG